MRSALCDAEKTIKNSFSAWVHNFSPTPGFSSRPSSRVLFDDVSSVSLFSYYFYTTSKQTTESQMDPWKNDGTLFNEYLCLLRRDFYRQFHQQFLFVAAFCLLWKQWRERNMKNCAIIQNAWVCSQMYKAAQARTHTRPYPTRGGKAQIIIYLCFLFVSFMFSFLQLVENATRFFHSTWI